MVHIYYGDGKGKTTAAVGLAIRASGNGNSVLFTQFLKGDISGERRILECIPTVTMPKLPEKVRFVFDLTPEEHAEYKERVVKLFNYIKENINKFDMIIADEIFSAVDVGFISLSDINELVTNCPKETELVLTGHNLDKSILVHADYATYMSKIKHPYDSGLKARQGIEF
ncbi:MAG: cob(I)yrinic acid a,c-diamide adenosyltransferase [Acutalibacteraceae bacterium]|nr:cob(I)yrinic acid a,c-diamide adenosyltransferase [Acutalibacteraceae bacterium]